ncbi:ABC transporter ATP-binding protein [Wenyingzhuangia sp. IMCC45574]
MEKTILRTRDLTVGYHRNKKKSTVCTNINLDIYSGEIICLLGRNGAGKSTLLKTLGNLIPAISGEMNINAVNYQQVDAKIFAKNVALVLTDALPESPLTVYETVALGRQPYTNWLGNIGKDDAQIILKALKQTDTDSLKNQYIHQLSDGQFQRVMIARALAQDSAVILLDEPTSHLDIHHKLNIFKLLHKICKETEKTIIISTHEVNLALKHSNRLLLIDKQETTLGTISEPNTITKLKAIFNSDDIQFDTETNQFVF